MPVPFIMVAPTGARRGKGDHPKLPITIDEITDTAASCQVAGAQGFHLHIRDADGAHSLDPGHYAEAIAAVADRAPDLQIQITTEAAGRFDVADQLHCIKALRPEWASVSVKDMARADTVAARLYAVADEGQTRIQHILFDAADAALLSHWRQSGRVRPSQTDVIFVLGRYDNGPASDPSQIMPFVTSVPEGNRWMVCAFGAAEHVCLIHAAALGGDVRVGFENSTTTPAGEPWRDNAASVAALRRAILDPVLPTES